MSPEMHLTEHRVALDVCSNTHVHHATTPSHSTSLELCSASISSSTSISTSTAIGIPVWISTFAHLFGLVCRLSAPQFDFNGLLINSPPCPRPCHKSGQEAASRPWSWRHIVHVTGAGRRWAPLRSAHTLRVSLDSL